MDENEMVSKAQSGDSAAFEQIVRAYEKKVYNTALRFVGNQQDAMDISQEVFLRIFRFLRTFEGQSSFSTWVYKITLNACHDAASKTKKLCQTSLEATVEDETFERDIPDMRFDPESEFERRQMREEIKKGIAALDEINRRVIVMRDVNGMSYGEISAVLEISEGTVKSRISRAREKLRLLLTQSGNFSQKAQSKMQKKGAAADGLH